MTDLIEDELLEVLWTLEDFQRERFIASLMSGGTSARTKNLVAAKHKLRRLLPGTWELLRSARAGASCSWRIMGEYTDYEDLLPRYAKEVKKAKRGNVRIVYISSKKKRIPLQTFTAK